MVKRPLAGIRVLDLGMITAGASSSALLADFGADVMKVESGSAIDLFRTWDGREGGTGWWNRSRFFRFTNRNKRGLGLDLKSADGRALFLRLVARSDVVLENFRRGVLERLNLTFADLLQANPRIILASITSQGEAGPDRTAPSYGSTLDATSGLSSISGTPDGMPVISGVALNYPDQIVSIFAAGMVVAAVLERNRTGQGVQLDIPQRELASFLRSFRRWQCAASAQPWSPMAMRCTMRCWPTVPAWHSPATPRAVGPRVFHSSSPNTRCRSPAPLPPWASTLPKSCVKCWA
jgi:crotonobetainyl-CoA:carnitine CoA-transferase CaiB-like acyl-CoA transferase